MYVSAAHHCHDISDPVWTLLKPHLPGCAGRWDGIVHDSRLSINALLCSGSCVQRLYGAIPPDLGHWSNTHRHFIRWWYKKEWEKLLEILIDKPDYKWLMSDASHVKGYPPTSGARGSEQNMVCTAANFIHAIILVNSRKVQACWVTDHNLSLPLISAEVT